MLTVLVRTRIGWTEARFLCFSLGRHKLALGGDSGAWNCWHLGSLKLWTCPCEMCFPEQVILPQNSLEHDFPSAACVRRCLSLPQKRWISHDRTTFLIRRSTLLHQNHRGCVLWHSIFPSHLDKWCFFFLSYCCAKTPWSREAREERVYCVQRCRAWVHDDRADQHGSKQIVWCWRSSWELTCWGDNCQAEKRADRNGLDFQDLKSTHPHWHTSSNMATSRNPAQRALLTLDQALKHASLWVRSHFSPHKGEILGERDAGLQ